MYRCCFFFFNDTATTEIYTLSLHDALPISGDRRRRLKTKPGRELQVHGSGALIRWLLGNDLVDEMNLFVFPAVDRKSTRLNSSHANISYAVFCLKKKKQKDITFTLIISHYF